MTSMIHINRVYVRVHALADALIPGYPPGQGRFLDFCSIFSGNRLDKVRKWVYFIFYRFEKEPVFTSK